MCAELSKFFVIFPYEWIHIVKQQFNGIKVKKESKCYYMWKDYKGVEER